MNNSKIPIEIVRIMFELIRNFDNFNWISITFDRNSGIVHMYMSRITRNFGQTDQTILYAHASSEIYCFLAR